MSFKKDDLCPFILPFPIYIPAAKNLLCIFYTTFSFQKEVWMMHANSFSSWLHFCIAVFFRYYHHVHVLLLYSKWVDIIIREREIVEEEPRWLPKGDKSSSSKKAAKRKRLMLLCEKKRVGKVFRHRSHTQEANLSAILNIYFLARVPSSPHKKASSCKKLCAVTKELQSYFICFCPP